MHGARDRPAQEPRGQHGRQQRDHRDPEDGAALAPQQVVDIARVGRQQHDALDRVDLLDWGRHRHDLLVAVVEQDHAGRDTGQGLAHFGIIRTAGGIDLAIHRQMTAQEHRHHARPRIADLDAGFLGCGGDRCIGPTGTTAQLQLRAIGDQLAVGLINAHPHIVRLDQPPQDRCHPFRRDCQFHRGKRVVPERARVGRIGKAVGIELHPIGIALRVRRDGDRNHPCLRRQALDFGINQPGMVLAENSNAADQDEQAEQVRHQNAPPQRLRAKAPERRCAGPGDKFTPARRCVRRPYLTSPVCRGGRPGFGCIKPTGRGRPHR